MTRFFRSSLFPTSLAWLTVSYRLLRYSLFPICTCVALFPTSISVDLFPTSLGWLPVSYQSFALLSVSYQSWLAPCFVTVFCATLCFLPVLVGSRFRKSLLRYTLFPTSICVALFPTSPARFYFLRAIWAALCFLKDIRATLCFLTDICAALCFLTDIRAALCFLTDICADPFHTSLTILSVS